MRDYTIIIPSCTENNLRVCLEALSKQPGWRDRVQVYDSDPTGRVENVCEDYGVVRSFDIGLRPFVFSRAVNECMDLAPDRDVIVMNDDALLQTIGGLEKLHYESAIHPEFGIVSSSIFGFVGNPEQSHRPVSTIHPIRIATLHTLQILTGVNGRECSFVRNFWCAVLAQVFLCFGEQFRLGSC